MHIGYLCKDVQGENINKIITAVVKAMDVGEETLPAEAMAIRLAGFKCLTTISTTFYAELEAHMSDIVNYTPLTAARIGEDSVVNGAIEFWISICYI